QGRRHRAGRDHESFRLEAPDQKGQEHDDERLDRLAPAFCLLDLRIPRSGRGPPRTAMGFRNGSIPTPFVHGRPLRMDVPGSMTPLEQDNTPTPEPEPRTGGLPSPGPRIFLARA